VDETGFKQRNGDGQNAAKTSGGLWVAVTPLIICFQVILSRGSTAAQTVLGEAFAGFITSEFVSRLLTVVSSLNLQERNILDFLVESISANRSGEIPPSLLR
jgi:Transposase IS66 family